MSLDLERKKAIVAEVAEVARAAHSAVAAQYLGLSVAQMTQLRNSARTQGVYLRVVRNTLARRALEGSEFACMRDGLVGPLVLAFSREDPGAAARVIDDFAKTNDKLVVRLVAVGGRLLEPSAIKSLVNLPTREQALSRLMAVMQAPIARLARTLAEPYARLTRVMGAIRDAKPGA